MPITELATLRLHDPSASVHEILLSAKAAMEKFTGYHFGLLVGIDDPSLVTIIGQWDSMAQHMNEWIPSKENQALLSSLQGKAEVKTFAHVDVALECSILNAQVIVIERYVVQREHETQFKRWVECRTKEMRKSFSGQTSAGWRIEKIEEDANDDLVELVLFSSWTDLEKYRESKKLGDTEEENGMMISAARDFTVLQLQALAASFRS